MTSNQFFAVVVYFLLSLGAFLIFYSISRSLSGANLTPRRFWFFFIFLVLWGGIQLGVARDGYILLYLPFKGYFEGDSIVRWIAFVGAVLQVACVPGKVPSKRWFARR